jgi:F420H(2)-dependent biliverdin reductase
MTDLAIESQSKLENSQNIWIASVRPDGRPHLVPVWFVWQSQKIYICIDASSVKAGNIRHNPLVAMALEDGLKPVICEGQVAPVESPWPGEVISAFYQKYNWDITQDDQYTLLCEITPHKWLNW